MIELRGVSKSYNGTVVVQRLDLTIPPGKTTVLIGPSGCGKSTLLRLMVGLVQPDAGQVLFRDEPLTPDNAPRVRRQIGFVVQDGGLFPHLTARGNVTLLARHLGREKGWMEQRLRE